MKLSTHESRKLSEQQAGHIHTLSLKYDVIKLLKERKSDRKF